jgi:hypothetical protein
MQPLKSAPIRRDEQHLPWYHYAGCSQQLIGQLLHVNQRMNDSAPESSSSEAKSRHEAMRTELKEKR